MKLILTAALALLVSGAIIVVSEQHGVAAAPSCTIVGSRDRDLKSGTRGDDVICLLPGNDYGTGNRGNDRIRGGAGNDTVVGNAGRDRLSGGPGNDRIFANDKSQGNDRIRGGAGFDVCFADPGDAVNCEHVSRGASEQTVVSALTVVDGAVALGEEAQASPSPTPTAPPGTTVTVTITAPPIPMNPQCTPPPASPPPNC